MACFSFRFPYNYRTRQYRVLWHQTLDTILKYSELPKKSINFDVYPISKPKINNQLTLSSVVTTRHMKAIEDSEIVEVWPADDLSVHTQFFYELYRMFVTDLDTDDHLIWYPRDKTDKAFSIEALDLIAGSSSEMEVTPIHDCYQKDYRYLQTEIQFRFRVRKVFDIPDAVVYVEGV